MLSDLKGQKRVPDPLGHELPMTMHFHMGDENQMLVLWNNSQYSVKTEPSFQTSSHVFMFKCFWYESVRWIFMGTGKDIIIKLIVWARTSN